MNRLRLHFTRDRVARLAVAIFCMAALPSAVFAQLPGYEVVRLGSGNFNRLTFTATIEGKTGTMVVDTGAAGTFLGEGKFGFLRPGVDRQLPAGVPKTASINGSKALVGYARDFHVGNANLGALPLRLVPDRDIFEGKLGVSATGGRQYDGYLGEEILRHFNAVVDAGRLILYLNTDSKRKTDAGRGLVAAGWTRVPMSDLGRDFTVECSLNRKSFRLIVDTGAPFTVLDDHTVRNAQLAVTALPMRAGIIETRAQEASLVITDSLTIGSYVATGVHLVSQPNLHRALNTRFEENAPVVGLLGGDILRRQNAIIDIGNKALYLKPPAGASKR